jgi:hypothetical protein
MDTLLDFTPLGLAIKARNAVFDTVFYDVSSLTLEEWIHLNPMADRKGKIIVVSPTGSPKTPSIRHYSSVPEFMHSPDWQSVFAIAVTGVGSSVVGTAALARNVADACKDMLGGDTAADVAGVVSGFGASDVVQEGLGGYFFYGMLNQFRFLFETGLENAKAIISDTFAKGPDIKPQLEMIFGEPLEDYFPTGTDVHALETILNARFLHYKRSKIRLLVGHSKGNLLIADVLDHMSDELKQVKHDGFNNVAVVTLGAVVHIAEDMIPKDHQYQFLGYFDGLGRYNSRWTKEGLAPHTSLPAKWHSLNTRLPLHTDVFDILRNQVKIPPPPSFIVTRGGKDQVSLEEASTIDSVGLQRRTLLEEAWSRSAEKSRRL